tara:strand:- start:60 stop:758 length:699 start_codon:yes stop_codon:yes gene_type:complete
MTSTTQVKQMTTLQNNFVTDDPVDANQRVLVRQTATGFEQGIAALAGLCTAGPLGALASWGAIRGLQGKWTPWFILGVPSAVVLNAVQIAVAAPYLFETFQQHSDTNTSAAQYRSPYTTTTSYREIDANPRIPFGKAYFKSGTTGKEEIIGVSVADRKNANGHIAYDAQWSDGYKSTYVFWSNGDVEIFSKDGSGDIERTPARYSRENNGEIKITANTGSVTIFPNLNPSAN